MKKSRVLRMPALLFLMSVLALALVQCGGSGGDGGSSNYPGPWGSCGDEISRADNECIDTQCNNCVGFGCLYCLSYCSVVADQTAYSCCYRTFSGDEADECYYHFVPEARPCSVSGRVTTISGAGVRDVELSSNRLSSTVLTDNYGNYTINEIYCVSDSITPSKSGYCFSPESRSYNLTPGDNVTGQDYTALQTCYSLSGTVTDAQGAPVPGVAIGLSGALAASTVTDQYGIYSFHDLTNGTYTITPGILTTPVSRTVTINNATISGQGFVTVN